MSISQHHLTAEERELLSCPCQFEEVGACHSQCTCANPFLSGGCRRCCRYGSDEQQLAKARRLAIVIDAADWEGAI